MRLRDRLDRRHEHRAVAEAQLRAERIARDQNLGLSWFGPLAYFGLPAAARRLRTVTKLRENEARQLSSKINKGLLRERRAPRGPVALAGAGDLVPVRRVL